MTAKLPTSTELKPYLMEALRKLGGEADNAKLSDYIAKQLQLSDALLEVAHDPKRGRRTEFEYRLAWARTRLRTEGRIERAGSKVWRLAGHAVQKASAPDEKSPRTT